MTSAARNFSTCTDVIILLISMILFSNPSSPRSCTNTSFSSDSAGLSGMSIDKGHNIIYMLQYLSSSNLIFGKWPKCEIESSLFRLI